MQANIRHILLSGVASVAVLWGAARAEPMSNPAPPAASHAEVIEATVSYLDRHCGVEPSCGTGEPLLVSLLDGWESDVRLKVADLVSMRFGFALQEQNGQLSAPVDDLAPVFLSDYNQVPMLPAHSIEVRRQRNEAWR